MPQADFKGQTIWLVGASEGIGRALALQLADAGATLFLSARNRERLQSLLANLPGQGHVIVACDVTQAAHVAAAWAGIAPHNPDMVIYNTGTYEPLAADQFDLARVTTMVDTNLHGALRVLSHVIPFFTMRRGGRIILTGSIAGYRGLPGALGYSLSKAAIINLAESLKCDLQRYNIGVQLINPSFVKTRLTDKNDFKMMSVITPEAAARHIICQLNTRVFEIRFPWAIATLFGFFRLIPASIYFKIFVKK